MKNEAEVMRRRRNQLLILSVAVMLLSIMLTGCMQPSYTIEKDGVIYSVDPEHGNLSDGTTFCTYSKVLIPEGTEITVIFPDGSNYWWVIPKDQTSAEGHGGWSSTYDENRYGHGMTWIQVLEAKPNQSTSSRSIVAILILIIVGLFMIAAPELAANMRIVGKKKPVSAFTLHVYRSIGVLAVAAGIYFWVK